MSVLQRVAAKDSNAMRECVAQFGALVWSVAKRTGLPTSDCEDLCQEVFAELWTTAHRFDPSLGSESAFVVTIARRRVIDRLRRLGSQRQLMGRISERASELTPVAEPSVDLEEQATSALKALALLSPDQQRVLRLAVEQGLTHERIATSTGLPLGTVKTHARRGLMKLRALLRPELQPLDEEGVTS